MGAGGQHCLHCCCPGSTRLPARCLASPPYLGLNKLSSDPLPGAALVPVGPALPYPVLLHACCPSPKLGSPCVPGVKTPQILDSCSGCAAAPGLSEQGRQQLQSRAQSGSISGSALGHPQTKMGPTPWPGRGACPQCDESWQRQCLWCHTPQSRGTTSSFVSRLSVISCR